MKRRTDQHTVGVPERLRGQEMGRAGMKDKNREQMENTPALRGDRKTGNKMFADNSSRHIAANPSAPSDNSPSNSAVLPGNVKPGESGGEKAFKQRHSGRSNA